MWLIPIEHQGFVGFHLSMQLALEGCIQPKQPGWMRGAGNKYLYSLHNRTMQYSAHTLLAFLLSPFQKSSFLLRKETLHMFRDTQPNKNKLTHDDGPCLPPQTTYLVPSDAIVSFHSLPYTCFDLYLHWSVFLHLTRDCELRPQTLSFNLPLTGCNRLGKGLMYRTLRQ